MPLSPPGMASGGVSNNTAVARMMMMSSSVADQQQQQTNLQQRMNQQQSNMAALQQQQQQQHQQLQNPMAAFNQDLMYDPNTGQQLYQQGGQHQPAGAKPAGTITGMLADFSRALGNDISSLLCDDGCHKERGIMFMVVQVWETTPLVLTSRDPHHQIQHS